MTGNRLAGQQIIPAPPPAPVAIDGQNQLDCGGESEHVIESGNHHRCANEVSAQACLTVAVDDAAMRRVEAFVSAFAAEHGLCADDRARTLIVLEELITNLRKYGYAEWPRPGVAEVILSLEPGPQLVIELIDQGQAFDPFAPQAPDLDRPLDARPVGGLGLHIVHALTEGRRYRRVGEHNVTELLLRVELFDTP